MNDRTKAFQDALEECTAVARDCTGPASAGAWSCVRILHKMLQDEVVKNSTKVTLQDIRRQT